MPPDTINVVDFIDQHKITRFQWVTIFFCALVMLLDGFDNQAIGYVAPALTRALHIDKSALGAIFGAGLFGYTIGTVTVGMLADTFGRRKVIIGGTLAFGLLSLLTVTANSLTALLVIRFLTGLALGGAMPNAIALVSEYSPKRIRATLVTLTTINFPVGAAAGGLLAARFIPQFGWKGIFYIGGLLPLAVVFLLAFGLPESVRLMIVKRRPSEDIARVLRKIDPHYPFSQRTSFVTQEEVSKGFPVKHLFTHGRALATVLLWIAFFMHIGDLQFLANWLPTVIHNAGIPEQRAVTIATLFHIGGAIGGILIGRLIDKWGAFALVIAFCGSTLFLALLGSLGMSSGLLAWLVFGVGWCVAGGQQAANAFAGGYYPTFIRSTGVGWALGVGRLGAVFGPVVAGILLSLHWQTKSVFHFFALPAFCAAAAIFAMARITLSKESAPTPAEALTATSVE